MLDLTFSETKKRKLDLPLKAHSLPRGDSFFKKGHPWVEKVLSK